jgi:phospholipase C
MGFTFDRLGVRVPAIAISAWIPERRVVTDAYRHTSLIRTLREHWSLGAPFTARDATAPDLAPILSLDKPRAPEDWPDVKALPVPPFDAKFLHSNRPLGALGKGLLFNLLEFEKSMGATVPELSKDDDITIAQADEIVRNATYSIFPGLRT